MADYHILFGFKDENSNSIPKIVSAIRSEGHTVTYTERTTKESISAYLEKNPSCTCAVLRECLGPESFSAVELASLTDTRDINIVVLVDSEHKGTNFMDTLYAAGITSAIIVDSNRGASVGKIAELLLQKRTRKAARKYYGLQEGEMRIEALTYGEYILNYSFLMNTDIGLNIVDRFLEIAKKLSAKQVAKFITSLPANVLKELQGYEEFWLVIDALKKSKININGTKPANLKKGLTEEQFRKAIQEDYSLQKKKGIPGPHATIDKKSTEPKDSIEKDVEKTLEEEHEESLEEAAEKLAPQNNYFEEEMNREKKTDMEESSTDSSNHVKAEKQKETEVVPEEKTKKTVEKETKKKESKKKKKVNWKYTLLISVVSILLIAAWYYLVFVYKI